MLSTMPKSGYSSTIRLSDMENENSPYTYYTPNELISKIQEQVNLIYRHSLEMEFKSSDETQRHFFRLVQTEIKQMHDCIHPISRTLYVETLQSDVTPGKWEYLINHAQESIDKKGYTLIAADTTTALTTHESKLDTIEYHNYLGDELYFQAHRAACELFKLYRIISKYLIRTKEQELQLLLENNVFKMTDIKLLCFKFPNVYDDDYNAWAVWAKEVTKQPNFEKLTLSEKPQKSPLESAAEKLITRIQYALSPQMLAFYWSKQISSGGGVKFKMPEKKNGKPHIVKIPDGIRELYRAVQLDLSPLDTLREFIRLAKRSTNPKLQGFFSKRTRKPATKNFYFTIAAINISDETSMMTALNKLQDFAPLEERSKAQAVFKKLKS